MGDGYRLGGWPLAIGGLVAGLLAEVNYRRLPVAEACDAVDGGKVTIIVPARNEERRITTLLRSLQRLDYVNYEIVVVDDASEDDTSRLARDLGATVMPIEHLPDGWTGKAYACWEGACRTTGDWLLFTDADTVHHPQSLSTAIAIATATQAGIVSFLCRQTCRSFWERLLLPYAYALYFVGRLSINTSERSAVANGQYILMRRTEYERIGGHGATRDSVIDDVALARRAHACGVTVLLLRGEQLVDVRMYEDLASLWEGLSKNAVLFIAVSPVFGAITVVASLVFGGAFPGTWRAKTQVERIAVYAAPVVAILPWMRRFGVPNRYALLYPVAAGTFQLIAFDSMRRLLLQGGVQWKGRRY